MAVLIMASTLALVAFLGFVSIQRQMNENSEIRQAQDRCASQATSDYLVAVGEAIGAQAGSPERAEAVKAIGRATDRLKHVDVECYGAQATTTTRVLSGR